MDDYLSKPIDRAKLEAAWSASCRAPALASGVLKEAHRVPRAPTARAGGTLRQPVDWDALLESIDGDNGFARELADAFVGTGDRELAAIAAALGTGDAASLRESAHTLKGTSANLRASAAASAAAQLESPQPPERVTRSRNSQQTLTSEVKRTIAFLRSMG